MKRSFGYILVFSFLALLPTGVWGGNPDSRESRFSVYSHGFRIGESTSVCSLTGNGNHTAYKFSNTTKVNANFLLHSYSMEKHEDALVGKDGTLRYTRFSKENGNAVTVEGALANAEFRIKVTEKKVARTLSIPRERYDYTTMECPEIHMKREGEKMTVRLLDFEALDVVTRRYTWVRSENLQVGGKTYTFRVIDFEDKNKKCRRWIRSDEVGVMIARQEGNGKSGSYSVKLVEYKNPQI